jgi:hypothetical protein
MVDFEIKSERYQVAAWSLPNPHIIVFAASKSTGARYLR